jgi:F-type H+-transporting ATPase subunit alpha
VTVPAQITILLALTAGLFDPVALEAMTAAEHAVQQAAGNIPAEIVTRLESTNDLNESDRKAIVDLARQALLPFQPKPTAAA